MQLSVGIFSQLSTLDCLIVDSDLLEFSDRLWIISKHRKIKNAFSMSSVYLFRGKSKSAIEVNFKIGIYLNLDVIDHLDLQISPSLPPHRNEVSYLHRQLLCTSRLICYL